MKKTVIAMIMMLALCSCATTSTTNITELTTQQKALKVIKGGERVLGVAGPLITAGMCIAYPEYCVAAKAAYVSAKKILVSMETVTDAESGTRLATLVQEFQADLDSINTVLAKTGQQPVDVSPFVEAYKSAVTAQ